MSSTNLIQKSNNSNESKEIRIAFNIAKSIMNDFTGSESDYAEPLKKQYDYGNPEKIQEMFKKRKNPEQNRPGF